MSEDLGNHELPPPPDLKTAEGVKQFMSGSVSDQDWNTRTDQVKAANNGEYPGFWFSTVISSNLAKETSAKWGGTDEIKVSHIRTTPDTNDN